MPVAGGIYTAPDGRSHAVELELAWRPGYSLARLVAEQTAERRSPRVNLNAVPPSDGTGLPGSAGGRGDVSGDDGEVGDDVLESGDGDAEDNLKLHFGGFALRVHDRHRQLDIGSDVGELGPTVYAEGEIWFYDERAGHWRPIPPDLLRRVIHGFDGAAYQRPNGKTEIVQLSKNRCDSITREMAAILAEPDFFKNPTPGVNVGNGLITFLADGTPELVPHCPEHRQRHVIAGKWERWMAEGAEDPPEGSMLHTLLHGAFLGDPDIYAKICLVGELAGAAMTGCMSRLRQKKAFIFWGLYAENGKSQIIDLFRAMLPEAAVGAVPPNKFAD